MLRIAVSGSHSIIRSVFLPRDAMHKRGLCCRPMSVTFVYCIQTAEDIVKLLSQLDSPCILVFF